MIEGRMGPLPDGFADARLGIVALVLVVAFVLPACISRAEPDPAAADEMFTFVVKAHPGGTAAEVARRMGPPDIRSGTEQYVGQVVTPTGRTDLLRFETDGSVCWFAVRSSGGNGSCEPPGMADRPGLHGWGSDSIWSDAVLRVPPDVDAATVTVTDGTTYRVTTLDGWGYVMWPSHRGDPTQVEYVTADGSATVIPYP